MQAEYTLPAVLRAVRCEMTSLGGQAQHLQDRLSPIARTEQGEALQALDLLTQRLFGLAHFLDTLIPILPDHTLDLAAALGVMTLSDQMRRLAGLPAHPAATAGGLELFDDA
jgi:hypothetical protein